MAPQTHTRLSSILDFLLQAKDTAKTTLEDTFQPKPKIDYSIAHPVPGLQKPLDYVPTKDDPLYVGQPLPNALLQEEIERASTSKAL